MRLGTRDETRPKTEDYTIHLTPRDRTRAEKAADYLDIPLSVFIRGAIRNLADEVLDSRPDARDA